MTACTLGVLPGDASQDLSTHIACFGGFLPLVWSSLSETHTQLDCQMHSSLWLQKTHWLLELYVQDHCPGALFQRWVTIYKRGYGS